MTITDVLSCSSRHHVAHSRCEAFTPLLPDGCVNLLWLDPPYFKVKDAPWDNAWDSPDAFLAWIDECAREWRRVLAPNGSVYVCASPQMSDLVSVIIRRYFELLNHIVWVKGDAKGFGRWDGMEKETQRAYFPRTERVLFAAPIKADAVAVDEAGYAVACAKLRTEVFEPLRAYLDGERVAAGVKPLECDEACGFKPPGGMASHWFARSQWALPTRDHYTLLQRLFAARGSYLLRPHIELEREYAELKRVFDKRRVEFAGDKDRFDALRRPFTVAKGVPTTDVWDYPIVAAYPGKHVCEKPAAMLRDVIAASSRPGDIVADFFCGSGVAGEEAMRAGRRFLGCDADERWSLSAAARTARGVSIDMTGPIAVPTRDSGPLFGGR